MTHFLELLIILKFAFISSTNAQDCNMARSAASNIITTARSCIDSSDCRWTSSLNAFCFCSLAIHKKSNLKQIQTLLSQRDTACASEYESVACESCVSREMVVIKCFQKKCLATIKNK